MEPTLSDRFWSKVDKFGPVSEHSPELGECWLWTASLIGGGYGQYHETRNGKHRSLYAHRVIYEALIGPIPVGLEIDHLCRVRRCVNPIHLEAVSHQENVLRGESLAAQRAKRTHCPQGHPYYGGNLYITPRDERVCVTCNRASVRAWQQRQRERKAAVA